MILSRKYGAVRFIESAEEPVLLAPDTIPDVIHAAAQPSGRQRSSSVDNSAKKTAPVVNKLSNSRSARERPVKLAVPENHRSICATFQSRSLAPKPSRLMGRLPVCDEAPAHV